MRYAQAQIVMELAVHATSRRISDLDKAEAHFLAIVSEWYILQVVLKVMLAL